jgi:8-oxo-dGTP pyrophosphatase MutT (NUDIX family)
LWQCVSGSLEPGERVVAGALRELREETGFGPGHLEALFDLDQVNQFHEPSVDAILVAAIFAVRVRRGLEPVMSHEHDALQWLSPEAALELAVWPAYRESIRRIQEDLLEPDRAAWFQLDPAGQRPVR